jgi:predicted metal-binding protein
MYRIMPAVEIGLKDIVFDPKVQNYCNNPKFRCPNYSHSWACPPEAPYMKNKVSQFKRFFLIFYKFDLKTYTRKLKLKFPRRSENLIINSFYQNDVSRDYLEEEILNFIKSFKEQYKAFFILWDGYCRVCYKEGKKCSYDLKESCRYPNQIRYSMEAVGIDVDKTVKNLNILIEWPPINYSYRFGLICFK